MRTRFVIFKVQIRVRIMAEKLTDRVDVLDRSITKLNFNSQMKVFTVRETERYVKKTFCLPIYYEAKFQLADEDWWLCQETFCLRLAYHKTLFLS